MKSQGQLDVLRHDMSMYKKCSRFGPGYKLLDHENALTYLKLRSEGCHRKNAKSFSSKVYCKVDATKEIDGPVSHRVLQVRKPIITTPNGWSYGGVHFNLGFKHCTTPNDFLNNDPQSKYFETHFIKHEEKIKGDYKSKIESLKKYFQEINSKCNFTKLSKDELFAKLKQENKELRSGQKWMDLEILTNQRSSRWIDDEPLLSPPMSSRLQTARLSSTLQTPKPPGLNKSIFSRRVSQETEAESVGLLQRPDLFSEPTTLAKIHHRAKSEMTLPEDHLPPKHLNLENIHESLPELQNEGDDLNELKLSTVPLNNEDFAKFQKAYEDLENHAQELINMASAGPEEYLELQLNRKNRTTSVNAQTPEKIGQSSPRASMEQKNALANEFNKINYFYYDKDSDNVVDPDSPTQRKKKAAFLGKLRREKQEIETNIFKAIVESQAEKGEVEGGELSLKNLESLRSKQEEIIQSIKRRTGLSNPGSHSSALIKHSAFHPSSASSRRSHMKTPMSDDIRLPANLEIKHLPIISPRKPLRKSQMGNVSDRKSSLSQNTNRSSLSKAETPISYSTRR